MCVPNFYVCILFFIIFLVFIYNIYIYIQIFFLGLFLWIDITLYLEYPQNKMYGPKLVKLN